MLRAYRNLKIRYKLFVIFFMLIFVLSIVAILSMHFSFTIYSGVLQKESAKVLNLSAILLEKELKKIENLSYSIMTNLQIQDHVRAINEVQNPYERNTAITELRDKLFPHAMSESYICSIHIICGNDEEYIEGSDRGSFFRGRDSRETSRIFAEALKAEGRNIWAVPYESSQGLVSARHMREIENLSLEPMGMVLIRLNLEKLVTKTSNIPSVKQNKLAISERNRIFFISDREQGLESITLPEDTRQAHIIKILNNKSYLISRTSSEYTDWSYINILAYDGMLNKLAAVRNTIFIFFMIFSLATAFVVVRYTRSITEPIEKLTAMMKEVEKGNFEIAKPEEAKYLSTDEIGTFYKDFNIMLRKINTLIDENYIRKIKIREAEYRNLQAQINPHFLYNVLESVNWMAKMNDQPKIAVMVKSLGALLRSSVNRKAYIVTLREELELLKDYVSIQKIRFENRLNFELNVDRELLEYTIPKLTIQPIVENCINHGLEKMRGNSKIVVEALKRDSTMRIAIRDNGPGISKKLLAKLRNGEIEPSGSGIGLKNIDERLRIIYGNSSGLSLDSEIGVGTTVSIHLPMHRKAEMTVMQSGLGDDLV